MGNFQTGYGHSDVVGVPFDFYTPLTGAAITMQTGILVLAPAGTIAACAVTLPLNPVDGAVAEISSTTQITALTVSANTGDSILGAAATELTILTATPNGSSRAVYRYSLAGANPISQYTGLGTNSRTWIRVA